MDDRYAHGSDGKRKDWVDDGRIRPDVEWRAGWMTGMRMDQKESGRAGWRGCERQGVWSVEIVTSTWNGHVAQAKSYSRWVCQVEAI